MSLLVSAFFIVAVAAAAQAITGFGFALLAVPLLALFSDAPTAVVVTALAGLAPTTITALRDRVHVRWRTAALLLTAAAAGMPFGLLVLHDLSPRLLTVVIAVVVLACTAIVWRGLRLPAGPATVGAVGVFAGVLSTATGTNGPPLVAAFQAMGYGPRTFRATLAAIFTGSGLLSVTAFMLSGSVSGRTALLGLAGVPGALMGWAFGDRVFAHLAPARFRVFLLAAMAAAAAAALVRALAG